MYFLCDRIIIHSEKGKEEIVDLFRVKSSKIHVIPHGDYKFFVPEKPISSAIAKTQIGISEECKTILFFGAIRENKGLKNILFALPQIKNKIHKVKLLIVGEPWEDYNKYRKIIIDQGLTDCICENLDYIPNEKISLYFSASDLVVLPYYEITGSGVLQIAYAFGKPVVATDLEGFREVIEDGKNGYLVDLKNVNDLSEKCISILCDENKAKSMGRYSKKLADTKFSWPNIAEKTIEVYNSC
jgi:glycosyltransferase involved in cell wall biosynthesis